MMHDTERQLKEAQAEFDAAYKKVDAARDAYDREVVIPLMRKFIGECFTYRNTYSGGEPWTLWVRIIGISERREFRLLHIERTSLGLLNVEMHAIRFYTEEKPLGNGYTPILVAEFRRGVRPLLKEIMEMAEAGSAVSQGWAKGRAK